MIIVDTGFWVALFQGYLQKYNRERIETQLNEVYSQESSQLDSALAKMQFLSLPSDNW